MYIHTFGAYYGMGLSFFFSRSRASENRNRANEEGYYQALISMIGTLYLWMFFPSFNAALATSA